jgi:hypothetical protein
VRQLWGSLYIQNCHITNLYRFENTSLTENCLVGFQLIKVIPVIRINMLSYDDPLTGWLIGFVIRKDAKRESITI